MTLELVYVTLYKKITHIYLILFCPFSVLMVLITFIIWFREMELV